MPVGLGQLEHDSNTVAARVFPGRAACLPGPGPAASEPRTWPLATLCLGIISPGPKNKQTNLSDDRWQAPRAPPYLRPAPESESAAWPSGSPARARLCRGLQCGRGQCPAPAAGPAAVCFKFWHYPRTVTWPPARPAEPAGLSGAPSLRSTLTGITNEQPGEPEWRSRCTGTSRA
jgi:hypothetical protein